MTDRDAPTANTPIPQYGIDRDYPLMEQMARDYDFAERLGGSTSPLHAEVDAALREIWMARNFVAEHP
jgi:hypothetical protein